MSSKGKVKPTQSPYSEALYTTVTPAIAGIVIVLNMFELFVIYKIRKNKRKKMSKSFIYITNLSLSDVLVGVVMIILKSMDPLMKTTLKGNVEATEFYDVTKYLFIRLTMFISIFNLLAMTLDRYLAITSPLKHRKLGTSFTYKIIAVVWFLSMVCVTIIYCVTRFKLSNVEKYNNMVFPISAYPTMMVFLICYPLIYKVVRKSNQNDLKRGQTMQSNEKRNGSTEKTSEKPTMKQEVKFLRIAVFTVGAFCFSWLPFTTCNLLIASGKECGGKDVERTFFTLAFTNSVLNPIIYLLCNMKAIKEVLWNKRSKKYTTVNTKTTSFSSTSTMHTRDRSQTATSAKSAGTQMKMNGENGGVLDNDVFVEK